MKAALRFLLAVGLGLASAWAQKSGTTTGTTTPTTGTTTGTTTGSTTSTTSPSTTTTTTTPAATAPMPTIFLSGTVMMDDGSPLPMGVNIQSVCDGIPKTVAHATSGGDFGFQWGNTLGIFSDASETGRISGSSSGFSVSNPASPSSSGVRGQFSNQLGNCDLRAQLAGYTSSVVNLYNHSSMDHPDVGAIILHRYSEDEGHTISALALRAPKDAKKNFDKGTDLVRSNKTAEAAVSFEKAVATYPQYADAWYSLGRAEMRLGATDLARGDFQKALELDDHLVGPWQELGYMASDQSKWEEAVKYLDRAIRLDPLDSAMAWYFDAMANYNLGRFDLAERAVRATIKLDTAHQNTHVQFLLGLIMIAKQDLKGGAAMLRTYIEQSPHASDVESAKTQLARVEGRLGK